jgi:hypothetical protein
MINMTLKWHHKNISNKITVSIKFWESLNMFSSSFDCDCTLLLISKLIQAIFLALNVISVKL